MRRVYLDHIAATPVHPDVLAAMLPYFRERFGNAQSLHTEGQLAQEPVAEARESVARLIGADPAEIVFVSCGSEANNMALKGIAAANKGKGSHLVLSAIEHASVLNAAKSLEKSGFTTTLVPVDGEGRIDPAAVAAAIIPATVLVSIQTANSEVGAIQPIAEIGRIVRERRILFHTDAVAAAGNIPLDVKALDLNALSLAGDQFYGPKGSAALYVRKGVKFGAQIDGGIQEGGKRGGTENVPAIVGLGKAAELARLKMEDRTCAIAALRDRLITELPRRIEHLRLTGPVRDRLPHHASFVVSFVEGEAMLLSLDMKGVAVSSGSACTSKSLKASHVQLAMGLNHAAANGSIVFSLLEETTAADIEYLLDVFPPIIDRLRKMSPLYTEFLKENPR
jgi:cysteine desulfurase